MNDCVHAINLQFIVNSLRVEFYPEFKCLEDGISENRGEKSRGENYPDLNRQGISKFASSRIFELQNKLPFLGVKYRPFFQKINEFEILENRRKLEDLTDIPLLGKGLVILKKLKFMSVKDRKEEETLTDIPFFEDGLSSINRRLEICPRIITKRIGRRGKEIEMVKVATFFAMSLGAFVFWQSMDKVHVWIALHQDEKVRLSLRLLFFCFS